MTREQFAEMRTREALRINGQVQPTQLGASQAQFVNTLGNPINTIACGETYSFQVPGYSRVWLRLTKDGTVTYDQAFDVPMQNYESNCTNDPGQYLATVFDLTNGSQIGQPVALTVTGGSILGSLSWTTWLTIGGLALFLFQGRKK